MSDTFESTKSEFIALMRRVRRVTPPLPPASANVTPAEARVLHALLAEAPQGDRVRPGLLSSRMRTTPSALSQVLGELEDKGFVVRTRDDLDSRRVMLHLTDEGERVARLVDDAYTDFARGLFEAVGPYEMRAFVDTFRRIVDYCETACADASARVSSETEARA